MKIISRILPFLIVSLLTISNVSSQKNLSNNFLLKFKPGNYSIIETFQVIEDLNDIIISYNPSSIDPSLKFKFSRSAYYFHDVLAYILKGYDYKALESGNNRIIIRISGKSEISIFGYLYDVESGNRLSGAIVEDLLNNNMVFSNEDGFFSIKVQPGKVHLQASYLGYNPNNHLEEIIANKRVNLSLKYNNQLAPVIITSDYSESNRVKTSGHRIPQSSIHSFGSVVGVDDVINRIRYLPGVQSGNEGVGGLFVRGGSNDQNLILYDGIPLYEISHTAGISSIFINESINNVEVFKSSLPAKYAGRLSSIIDITMKEGDQLKNNASISFGNYGPTMSIDGPILKSKLTYNITARTSWLHWYVNSLLSDVIDYDNVDIRFTDINTKLAWYISPAHKLTYTSYFGTDKLGLFNETRSQGGSVAFSLKEDNTLNWGTFLNSFNYDGIIGDKVQLSANAGHIKYNYQNRGAYSFRKFSIDDAFVDEIDVVSRSNIEDLRVGINIDYFISNAMLVRLGSNFTRHKFNPTLRQSTIILSGEDVDQIGDNSSFIYANELNAYVQHKVNFSKKIDLDAGINFTSSSVRNTTYSYLEPRLSIGLDAGRSFYTQISYSRMHQFVHLLVNPGLGLPSNLWVPSTETIKPEQSDQLNISIIKKFGEKFKLSFDAYQKWSSGLVEYLLSDGIYSTILNDSNFVPIFNEDKAWEDNIESGKGRANGIEVLGEGKWKKINYWISYSLSKTSRTFPNINEGNPFPYKYDRRHDLNLGLFAQINENSSAGISWVYGSGTAFTLALEAYSGIEGIELLNPGARNNFRLPAFHHLDLFYEIKDHNTETPFSFTVGVYNVYNQLNPYYVILYNDEAQERPVLKQVSIFPIFPYVSFKTSL